MPPCKKSLQGGVFSGCDWMKTIFVVCGLGVGAFETKTLQRNRNPGKLVEFLVGHDKNHYQEILVDTGDTSQSITWARISYIQI